MSRKIRAYQSSVPHLDIRSALHSFQSFLSERTTQASTYTCMASFVKTGEVKLADDVIECIAVCHNTSGFFQDTLGKVVSAEAASTDCVAMPQPCIFARVHLVYHLTVISVDFTTRMRCHCDIDWNSAVWGIHCDDRQLLFIAQSVAVMVTDLSGRLVTQICTKNFGFIKGICGNAENVYVTCGNRITVFNKVADQSESVIELTKVPDADLGSIAIHDGCLFVAEREQGNVLVVNAITGQLVANHPNRRTGLTNFEWPHDVLVDSQGRLFVTEFAGHSVRAVSIADGSLLWTLGEPGVRGEPDVEDLGRLWSPCGLARLLNGPRERLLVSDGRNHRILMFELN